MVAVADVLLVSLPLRMPSGHEQEGTRPVVVVALPERLGKPRFPLLLVVPLTTKVGAWVAESPKLYPVLLQGAGGLPFD